MTKKNGKKKPERAKHIVEKENKLRKEVGIDARIKDRIKMLYLVVNSRGHHQNNISDISTRILEETGVVVTVEELSELVRLNGWSTDFMDRVQRFHLNRLKSTDEDEFYAEFFRVVGKSRITDFTRNEVLKHESFHVMMQRMQDSPETVPMKDLLGILKLAVTMNIELFKPQEVARPLEIEVNFGKSDDYAKQLRDEHKFLEARKHNAIDIEKVEKKAS